MSFKTPRNINFFSVFQAEKHRVGKEFSIVYSEPKQRLTYFDQNNNCMIVRFGKDDMGKNCEQFYFISAKDKDLNLRTLPTEILDHDHKLRLIEANGTAVGPIENENFPEKMAKIFDRYTDPKLRNEIGLDNNIGKKSVRGHANRKFNIEK